MSKALRYATEQLASTGFVILETVAAMRLRPDLWTTGVECGADLQRKYGRQVVAAFVAPGCHAVTLHLEGIGQCQVLTRSLDDLERRIQQLTGFQALPMGYAAPQPPRVATPSSPAAITDDQFHGVVTKEPGRTCSGCEYFTSGHACKKAAISGLVRPAVNVPRRCLAFTPVYESIDGRTGVQLWPELKEVSHGA